MSWFMKLFRSDCSRLGEDEGLRRIHDKMRTEKWEIPLQWEFRTKTEQYLFYRSHGFHPISARVDRVTGEVDLLPWPNSDVP